MDEPIENLYFDWLCANVKQDNTHNYLELFRIMHMHEFISIIDLDDNRIADVLELRENFSQEVRVNNDWFGEGCSIFEILIAFSEKAAFQIDMPSQEWFWQFITNLKLDHYNRVSRDERRIIDNILHKFVMREYESNGDGGLFPLRRPRRDQRRVEIWYQFCDYVEDHGLLYELL